MPLAPRTARAVDLAIGERADGPIFIASDGHCPDRHGAARIVPHTLRDAFITAALDVGVPLRDVQEAASHDHALRPGQGLPRRSRHLHRRSSPLTTPFWAPAPQCWRPEPADNPVAERPIGHEATSRAITD